MKKHLLTLLMILAILDTHAQQPFYRTYSWEAEPILTKVSDCDTSEGQFILKDHRVIEYTYEKSGSLIVYITKHRRIKVFSERGIEENNKVYIPTSDVVEVMDVQARSISPTGKISKVTQSDMKDVDDIDNRGSYKMFAVEGIEKNSEIEYIYTCKKKAYFFGTEYCQTAVPRKNFMLKIISPRNLVYDLKLYNFAESARADTSSDPEHNYVSAQVDYIKLLKEEKYSLYSSNLARMEYKLAYNLSKGKSRLFTWDNAADRYYTVFCSYDKKEVAAVDHFLKKLKLPSDDILKAVRLIENAIKLHIEISSTPESEHLESILKNKAASKVGIARLYMCCLQQAGIKRELGLTCYRNDRSFDPSFDSWNFLDSYVIYLTDVKQYLSPIDPLSRVGYLTPELTGGKALFIKEIDMGDNIKSAIGKIKEVGYLPYNRSSSELEAKLTLDPTQTQTKIGLRLTHTGYAAYYAQQPIVNLYSDLQKRELQEALLKTPGEDSKLSNIAMSGYNEEDILASPFVLSADVTSPSIVETAGAKQLFHIGKLIGAQAELYQADKRETPVELTYTHGYLRTLIVTIPTGYKLSGLESLNMHTTVMQDNEVTAEFKSAYTLTDNTLQVTIIENYQKLYYPIEKFEDFRKVINAAANFNKITLILEKA